MLSHPSALLRRMLPLSLGVLCLWLLWQKSGSLDWQAVRAAFAEIAPLRWVIAAAFTAGSFWSLAQYDLIAHRHFGTGTKGNVARRAGAAAISLGQVIGMGPAVGAAVRWRLMPGLGHTRILQLTAFVTLTFLATWAVLALGFALPILSGLPWLVLPTLVVVGFAAAAALFWLPEFGIGRYKFRLPSLPAATHLLALSFCDMIFASLALFVLLPTGLDLSLLTLTAAYMLALGAGLIGGTPGGVGPFELALTGLLPHVDIEILAAALLAYRAIYYALPCLVGAAYAMTAAPDRSPQHQDQAAPLTGPRAEHGIAAQADTIGLQMPGGAACLLRSPQTLTLFLGPTHGNLAPLLPELGKQARQSNRLPCLYKVAARDAAVLRQSGWHVAPLAIEAVLTPAQFTLEGAERRQLRRSLRKAQKSGVEILRLFHPNWSEMAKVNAAWATHHGGERGLTMGRFCPEFLTDKPIFAAYQDGKMLAFASCVHSDNALSLDLMRQYPNAPIGTMQALVTAIVEYAKQDGFDEVSLAALPHPALARFAKSADGLARFKTSFSPNWRPLYIAAPGRIALGLAALDLWRSIRFPEPLPEAAPSDQPLSWEEDSLATAPSAAQDPPERKTG